MTKIRNSRFFIGQHNGPPFLMFQNHSKALGIRFDWVVTFVTEKPPRSVIWKEQSSLLLFPQRSDRQKQKTNKNTPKYVDFIRHREKASRKREEKKPHQGEPLGYRLKGLVIMGFFFSFSRYLRCFYPSLLFSSLFSSLLFSSLFLFS